MYPKYNGDAKLYTKDNTLNNFIYSSNNDKTLYGSRSEVSNLNWRRGRHSYGEATATVVLGMFSLLIWVHDWSVHLLLIHYFLWLYLIIVLLKITLFPLTTSCPDLENEWTMRRTTFHHEIFDLMPVSCHSLLLGTFHSRSILSTRSTSPSLTWADYRGRVAMGTVRTTQGSHRTTP